MLRSKILRAKVATPSVRLTKCEGLRAWQQRLNKRGVGLSWSKQVSRIAGFSDRGVLESDIFAECHGDGEEVSLVGKETSSPSSSIPKVCWEGELPTAGVSGDVEGLRSRRVVRKHSEETKRKISEAHQGRRLSDEHRRKISEGKKGKRFSDEHRKKLSLAKLGRKRNPELMKMIGEKKKGYRHSLQARIKISKARMGQKASAETKAKMSASHKARWEQRLREVQLQDIIMESKLSRPKVKVDTEAAIVDLSRLRRELTAWLHIWYQENTEKPSLREMETTNPLVHGKFMKYLNLMDAMREKDFD